MKRCGVYFHKYVSSTVKIVKHFNVTFVTPRNPLVAGLAPWDLLLSIQGCQPIQYFQVSRDVIIPLTTELKFQNIFVSTNLTMECKELQANKALEFKYEEHQTTKALLIKYETVLQIILGLDFQEENFVSWLFRAQNIISMLVTF